MNKRGTAVLVLGHRGYRARFPENTLLGVRMAFQFGADGVECDLQKTSDGHYVVIHDPFLERVSGIPGELRSLTFEQVRGVDLGGGERVPELAELLSAIPSGKYLDLELKCETLTVADCISIASILAPRIDPAHLMISSFEPRLLFPFKGMGYTIGLLVGRSLLSRGVAPLAATIFRMRPGYANLPMDVFSVLGTRKSRLLLRFLRSCGLRLLFWTVNSVEDAESVMDFAHIVVTDEVEGMLRLRSDS